MIIVWLCWSGGKIEVQKVLTSQLYIVGGSLIGGKCPMHWPDQKMEGGVGQGRNINDEGKFGNKDAVRKSYDTLLR